MGVLKIDTHAEQREVVIIATAETKQILLRFPAASGVRTSIPQRSSWS